MLENINYELFFTQILQKQPFKTPAVDRFRDTYASTSRKVH